MYYVQVQLKTLNFVIAPVLLYLIIGHTLKEQKQEKGYVRNVAGEYHTKGRTAMSVGEDKTQKIEWGGGYQESLGEALIGHCLKL